MGIDQDEEILFSDLKKEFRSDSSNCDISSFKIVTKNDGSDYDLSPILAPRFNFGATSLKLINYMGNEQTLSLYVKGISSGDQGAYKPLKISYLVNKAPVVSGDLVGNQIEVREDDDNSNQI